MTRDLLQDRLLAVLAADVEGFSRLMAQDEHATVVALDVARAVFRDAIMSHGGRVVDMVGDSVLAVFGSASGALLAALTAQRKLARLDTDVPEQRQLRLRVGIHVGDVIEKADGTVYGDGVNTAARLQARAAPGGIAVSQAVYGIVAPRVPAMYVDQGEQALKNLARPVRIYAVREAAADERTAAPAPAPVAPTRPVDLSDGLFGRDELLAELLAQLEQPGARLLTLTGPGGSGKTRLALAATARRAPGLADGARVVMLAPVHEAHHLMSAVAQALGLQEGGAAALPALVRGFLRPRQLLLTLDNLEHLPEAAVEVAALLDACPRLQILATSRVLLNIQGEKELKVPPLALPRSTDDASRRASPAVALFAARAAALGRGVLGASEDLKAAAQICERLDGLPLAIELAAARLRVLTPVALASRLRQSLPMLKGGGADLPRRQQTLRDAIAWSHDLLDMPARQLFRRLGVFAGGWSLEAAEALVEGGDALDALETLVDHNLALRTEDMAGQPRFGMLQTIREYALEHLAAADETEYARERHADFFLRQAEAAAPNLTGGGRMPWLLRLRAEQNNFRLALDWLIRERRDTNRGLALTASLTWLWYFDGLYREGLRWMNLALDLPRGRDAGAGSAAVITGQVRLAAFTNDIGTACRLSEEAVARWRALGNQRGLAQALFERGVPAMLQLGREPAVQALTESRELFSELQDPWGIALTTVYLGVVHAFVPGLEEAALPLLEEGLTRCTALGDDWAASTCSAYIGTVAQRRGDFATARRGCDHILRQARETGDRFRIARSTHLLGELDLIEGRYLQALAPLAESLALTREQGREGDLPQLLRAMARAFAGLGRHEQAAELLGAGSPREGPRSTLPPEDASAVAAAAAGCEQGLGRARFDRLRAAAAQWSLDRGVEYALAQALSAA